LNDVGIVDSCEIVEVLIAKEKLLFDDNLKEIEEKRHDVV